MDGSGFLGFVNILQHHPGRNTGGGSRLQSKTTECPDMEVFGKNGGALLFPGLPVLLAHNVGGAGLFELSQ